MANTTEVNSQITDAITQVNVNVLGSSPAAAFGILNQTLAQAVGMGMQNSMQHQNGMLQIQTAIVASAVRQILEAGI